MSEFVNIHTHRREGNLYILDISDGKEKKKDETCSFGIHPLFIEGEEQLAEVERLAREKEIVAIGEAGMDRNSTTDMELQILLFERQIYLSEQYQLPLIIHCVRAYPELLSLHKRIKPRQAWIIHGFNNNRTILRELLRHGLYVSAGKHLFSPHSNIMKLLPEIPIGQLFIETDDAAYKIEQLYEKAADILKITPEELRTGIYKNYERLFTWLQAGEMVKEKE